MLRSTIVDPMVAARVYVAYGNMSKAIQVLQAALLTHPSRTDIKLYLDELCTKPLPHPGIETRSASQ